jgi:transposase
MAVPQMTVSMPAPHPSLAPSAPEPEVAATAKRRQFSSGDKRRILAAADRCTEVGEIGALLRREGIYSSQLATWRKQRAATERAGLEPQKRGRKANPALAEARRVAELTKENARLRRKLATAQTIIDVQKKLCTLLGLPTAEDLEETS